MSTRKQGWCLVGFALGSAALADALTGAEAWFGPIYLLVVCLATWTLGWREALAITVASFALLAIINNLDIYATGLTASAWTASIRLLTVATSIFLLEKLRRAHATECRLARTDPLTGALNRQAFFEWASTAGPSKSWGILAYADLDGLKQINDSWGHAAGDEALKGFASSVRSIIRGEDLFARVGGDEFFLHMSVESEEQACDLASRLHRRMNAASSEAIGSIRCSVGVVVLCPGSQIGERHMRLADRAMYEAKAMGASLRFVGAEEESRHALTRETVQLQAA